MRTDKPRTDGVLVIDKPLGLTSFDVVAQVRRACRERRVGHAGTLDPMASGVLVVCLGEATKLVPYLQDADKEYLATARLGVVTDTDDAAPGARVLASAPAAQIAALDEAAVRAALAQQVGTIQQRPPRFSALKVSGERLYDRAHRARAAQDGADDAAEAAAAEAANAEIEAQLDAKQRPVRIDAITIESLDLTGPAPGVTFHVRCGKGTYIRSIARDLGERLGVGAHLTALRRLRVGRFGLDGALALAALPPPRLCGLGESLSHLPYAVAPQALAERLRNGQKAALGELGALLPPAAADTRTAAVLDEAGFLIAVVEAAPPGWVIGRGFQRPAS